MAWPCWLRRNQFSHCPTATLVGAGTWTRVSRTACRAPNLSMVSSRSGRCRMRYVRTTVSTTLEPLMRSPRGGWVGWRPKSAGRNVKGCRLRSTDTSTGKPWWRQLHLLAGLDGQHQPDASPSVARTCRTAAPAMSAFDMEAGAAEHHHPTALGSPLTHPVRAAATVHRGRRQIRMRPLVMCWEPGLVITVTGGCGLPI